MGARGAVVLGRLGCGAILIGQRNQAKNLAGEGIHHIDHLLPSNKCKNVFIVN